MIIDSIVFDCQRFANCKNNLVNHHSIWFCPIESQSIDNRLAFVNFLISNAAKKKTKKKKLRLRLQLI